MSDLAQRIAQLSLDERIELETRLLAERVDERESRIPSRASADPAPLSFSQERLWFLAQLDPESSAYNEIQTIGVTGDLDIRALELSLDALAARHDTLRVCFREVGGQVSQITDPLPPTRIPIHDLTLLQAESQMAAVWKEVAAIRAARFDLAQAPLWRVALLKLADDDYVFVRVVHHIISDGWSNSIFWRELSHYYASFTEGASSAILPDLPISYADFSVWQREWLQGDRLIQMADFWKSQLADLQPLDLPTDFPRPPRLSHRGQREQFKLDQASSESLSSLARSSGTTLYVLLLAAFQILLHRYSGQDKVAVGSPIANRTRSEVEGLYGFFANTLVMYADCGDNPSFRTILAQVHQYALNAFSQQDLPFEKLVEEMRPDRELNRNPLFDVLFAFQNGPRSNPNLPGLECRRIDPPAVASKFDMSFNMYWEGAELAGTIKYATDLFEAASIRRMIGHFQTLLQAIIADPDQRLADLPLLTDQERHQLLTTWNDTRHTYSHDSCLHELFESQVEQTPDAVALCFKEERLTYRELNFRANRLAHYLIKHGVGPEVVVGIHLERSTSMVVALLAVLKAGGAYVPLEITYPTARLTLMISDAEVKVVLAQGKFDDQLQSSATVFDLVEIDGSLAKESQENPPRLVTPDNLAYVIYTSGSTGEPKGAMVTHRGICHSLLWRQEVFHLTPDDRILHKASFSFDVSVWELFWPLLAGAGLVIAEPGREQDSDYLVEVIVEQEISFIHFIPSALKRFLADPDVERCTTLRRVWSSGEALPCDLQNLFFSRLSAELLNGYGLAETSTVVIYDSCRPGQGNGAAPIGRPITNTQIYILDPSLKPVPIGVSGELFIGGISLARGYCKRPELTAEKFIPDPFSQEADSRLYRTGDLARYLPDGRIDFLGRTDHQIKVNGVRIELGEIEAVLSQHVCVQEAVVWPTTDSHDSEKQLVAYLVYRQGNAPASSQIRRFLQAKLPHAMVPAFYVQLDALPFSPNGKLDHRALPPPDLTRFTTTDRFVAPRTEVEETVAAIWASILGLERVGIHDDFFQLGGHSMKAVQMISRIRDALQVELPVRSPFEAPTVAEIAQQIETVLWLMQPDASDVEDLDEEGEL